MKLLAPSASVVLVQRTDIAPLKDVRVRQALSMAIDRDTIISQYFQGNAIADAWPIFPSNPSGYTPISQMPPDVAQYFQYHPDRSKQLLADAGYADGFETQVDIPNSPIDQDLLQLVTEGWAKIGVKAKINVVEQSSFVSEVYGSTFAAMAEITWGGASPDATFGYANGGVPTSIYNFSKVVDPIAVTNYSKWLTMTGPDADAFLKAEYLREDVLCWSISLPTYTGSVVWQPYLKGYSGESCMGPTAEMGTGSLFKFMWVDQTIKAKYK